MPANRTKKRAVRKRNWVPSFVKATYPTQFAVESRNTYPKQASDPLNSATRDLKAIRCYNCGAIIEAPDKETSCWRCSSDNFKGTVPY